MMSDTPLPGLSAPDPVAGSVEVAAMRTITGLQDRLDDSHAVLCQALLTAARQLDRAANSAKAKDYGVANLLAQLRETYVVLRGPEDEGVDDDDPYNAFAREMRAASEAAVRDHMAP